jgi:hypothetical protein
VVGVADVPLEVALPEGVSLPLASTEEEEGVVVGAGVATLKECQIARQEQETESKYTLPLGLTSKVELCAITRVSLVGSTNETT